MALSTAQYLGVFVAASAVLVVSLALLVLSLARALRALRSVRSSTAEVSDPERTNQALGCIRRIDARAMRAALVPIAYVAGSTLTAAFVQRNRDLAAPVNLAWLAIGVVIPLYVAWEAVAVRRDAKALAETGRCVPGGARRVRRYAVNWTGSGMVALVVAAVTSVNIVAIISDWQRMITLPYID